MTEIEQRIAIAEAWLEAQKFILYQQPKGTTGYRGCDLSGNWILRRVNGDLCGTNYPTKEACWNGNIEEVAKRNNYLESLDAMHEAEKSMDCLLRRDYVANLWKVCGFDADSANFWTEYNFRGIYALLHATAKQRAEAFLKTIGKWKDS